MSSSQNERTLGEGEEGGEGSSKTNKGEQGGKGSQNLEILSERTFWMSPINPIIAKNELSDSMSNWFNFDP